MRSCVHFWLVDILGLHLCVCVCVCGCRLCGFLVSFSWFFRLPIGSRVIGAFIMPCGNCSYCSKVILLRDATLIVLSNLLLSIIVYWLLYNVVVTISFSEKSVYQIVDFFWSLNWEKGHDDLCEDFFAYNRAKGTLYDGETRLFLHSSGKHALLSLSLSVCPFSFSLFFLCFWQSVELLIAIYKWLFLVFVILMQGLRDWKWTGLSFWSLWLTVSFSFPNFIVD